jgi:hypothetical protein
MEMKESQVLYYEAKQKQRGLHEVVTALKDKNAPAHALLEYVFLWFLFMVALSVSAKSLLQ